MSATEPRRWKHGAPPAELVPLADRAAAGADAVDVPADTIVPEVPSPHWWMHKGKDEKPEVVMLALQGEAEEFNTNNFNSRFPIAAKLFGEACFRPS